MTGDPGLIEASPRSKAMYTRNALMMASGTMVARGSGYLRSTLLVAALGAGLHADVFAIANTVPNMLYILLAGGLFNAVLVPQLVRAQHHPDGGEAFVNRIVTLAALFLTGVTIVLIVGAPMLMQIFLSGLFNQPEMAAQRQSVIDFARYCLPQVFFYGMFALMGQILNARGAFGPMMWAPVANNLISIAVLAIYLVAFGPATDGASGAFTPSQEMVLGLGATAGIVTQCLVLVPYLRATGFRFHPRFDFRGTGMGKTFRLGAWTVGFVLVNQIAYTIVVRLASGGPAETARGEPGTGFTVYSSAFLLVMVPHSVVTVSLATAILPRLAAAAATHDLELFARQIASTLRGALALIMPFAALLPWISTDLVHIAFGFGAGAATYKAFAVPVALFGIGLVFFTVHYLMLRAFSALERNRTAFWVQCLIAATNVTLALALVPLTSADQTAATLVVAYVASYVVGSSVSYAVLRRVIRAPWARGPIVHRSDRRQRPHRRACLLASPVPRHGPKQTAGRGSWFPSLSAR